MIPRLICWIFGHEIFGRRAIGKVGNMINYQIFENKRCTRCGKKLVEDGDE